LKILIITQLLAYYRVNWFNELGKYAEVNVLYTTDKESTRNENWFSNNFVNFKCKKLKENRIGKFEICFGVISELKKEYDIIVLDGYSFPTQILSILFLKLKNKHFFMNVDGGFICENESLIIRKVKRFLIKSPTYYLSSSKTCDKYLEFYGAASEKIFHHHFTSLYAKELLKNIIDCNEKEILKKQLNISEKKIVVTVGRFIECKGFDVLIKASQYISNDIGVYIIGGEPTEKYIGVVEKYGIKNVHFIGYKNKEKLDDYYKSADLFVFPTRGDVWGLVINEAMACGLPIITTDKCVAGLELVKDNENGYVIKVDDEKELAEKIDVILSDDKTRENMAQNSLEKIKEYTIENMAETHIKIFEQILGGAK
jgi:glycosyltransferase involved in cell wall biosynthesis